MNVSPRSNPQGAPLPADDQPDDSHPEINSAGDDAFAQDAQDEGEPDSEFLFEEGEQHRRFTLRRDLRKRIDVYLQQRLKGMSRNRVQKLIELGGVTINGKTPKASTVIRQGDVLDVILPPPSVRQILPEPIPLDIVYEDRDLVVINKQADLIVHPARGNLSGTLINGLAYHFQQQGIAARQPDEQEGAVAGLSQVGAEDYRPGIVHRLDRFTTGLMVVAKNDETHWQIARQFEDRQPLKCYLALVHNGPAEGGGVIDLPLGKHPTIREAYAVRFDSAGRQSVTIYRVRERYKGFSLIELELKTGRTHQIRVHLSYMGFPIAGDVIYGGEPVYEGDLQNPPAAAGGRPMLNFARERAEGQRIEAEAAARTDLLLAHPALHAALLSFTHPRTGERLRFQAPVHQPMRSLIRRLRQQPSQGPLAESGYHVEFPAIGL